MLLGNIFISTTQKFKKMSEMLEENNIKIYYKTKNY